MPTNLIKFPRTRVTSAANDDGPDGPAGNVISLAALRQRARMVRTLRGVILGSGNCGTAAAA